MKAEAPNIMQTIATTLAILASMTILIPFLLRLFIKPMIRDEVDSVKVIMADMKKQIDDSMTDHLRVDHGYGYEEGNHQAGDNRSLRSGSSNRPASNRFRR